MTKLQTNIDYEILSPVDIYRLVLDGKLNKFPKGYWSKHDAVENAVEILRYLFESILQWRPEDINEKISKQIFFKNGLSGMLIIVFHGHIWKAVDAVYPNTFKEWELGRVPLSYWNRETSILATKWLIEEKLKLTENKFNKRISFKVFANNGLSGMLNEVYKGSVQEAINAAYPNQFKERRLKRTTYNLWNHKTAKQVIEWLIEDRLKWNENERKEEINTDLFADNELFGVLKIYNYSTWLSIHAAYPNLFKEWKLQKFPKRFWNDETGIRATKWLIEEKLKWTKNDIKEKLSKKVFVHNGLAGMLNGVYNGSPWKAVNAAYPNKFKEWELKRSPKRFWNDETRRRATKWMIEEKLKWTDREIKIFLRIQTFKDHGLSTMMRKTYSNNLYKALDAAYPGRFQRSDFEKGRPKTFVDLE